MTKKYIEPSQQEFLIISENELKEKYPNLSKEDIDFFMPKNKILDFEIEFISYRKYQSLIEKRKELNNYNQINGEQKMLSEKELSQIEKYESRNKNEKECFQNELTYWDKVLDNEKKNVFVNVGLVPDKKTLYKLFLQAYKHLNGFDYVLTEESIKNIEPVIKYFSREKDFVECKNLIKKVGNKNLDYSVKKGLLLIGNVGNGKTSVMKTMQFLINHYYLESIKEKWKTAGDWNAIRYSFKTTEELVSEFEYLKTQEEKDLFFRYNSSGGLFLDDLKREKNASNYGITNVIASILEKRYNNLKKYTGNKDKISITHGTMNFHTEYPNDIEIAIQECGVRYGSHVYDRIFEMFNIVEFKGKSFRK